MKHILISRAATALALCAGTASALAHDGHGMVADSHWHASDAWGFVVIAVVAAVAVWLSRGGK